MKPLVYFVILTFAGLASIEGVAPKAGPTNKEKIVGTWLATFGDPPGSIFEYTKDGKLKMTIYQVDQTYNLEETYQVDGDVLKRTVKRDGGKTETHAWKIKTLTDKILVTEYKLRDGGGTVAEEYKKK